MKAISVKVWYEIKRGNDWRGTFWDTALWNLIQGQTVFLETERKGRKRKGKEVAKLYLKKVLLFEVVRIILLLL